MSFWYHTSVCHGIMSCVPRLLSLGDVCIRRLTLLTTWGATVCTDLGMVIAVSVMHPTERAELLSNPTGTVSKDAASSLSLSESWVAVSDLII